MPVPGALVGRQGVQLVAGSKPETPQLRPLKQPLYDQETFTQTPATPERKFFINIGGKTERQTNMTQSGVLGTPIEFSLFGFQVKPDLTLNGVAGSTTLRVFWQSGLFKFKFAQREWLKVPLKQICQGTALTGFDNTAAGVILHNGVASKDEFYNFSTLDGRAYHIYSTESFEASISNVNVAAFDAVAASVVVDVLILGVYMSNL